ncbi:MAG: hypothetical protein K6E11_04690 [Bacilli bacterium]|nr:hypothetical protein [Bacilli bacterium]
MQKNAKINEMDKLGKSLNALYVEYKDIQSKFLTMDILSMSNKSLDEFIERLSKFVDMFMEQWNQKYQEKRIQDFLKELIKTFNAIRYLFCDENHVFKNSSTIKIDPNFLEKYKNVKSTIMLHEATIDYYYKELALDVYGYSEVSGKPLTKTDMALSKIFITIFVIGLIATLIVVLVGVVRDILSNLIPIFTTLGAITALFLILAIIDIIVRKNK